MADRHEVFVVEMPENSDTKVAFTDSDVADYVTRVSYGEHIPWHGNTQAVPLWRGDANPPHKIMYRARCVLYGPISKHNRCARMEAVYFSRVHWPWSEYKGNPAIADVTWHPEAKDTEGIRNHLATSSFGLNMDVFRIEGYDAVAVYELAQRYMSLARSRYAVANILWTDAPLDRQVTDEGPTDWPIGTRHQEKLKTRADESLESAPLPTSHANDEDFPPSPPITEHVDEAGVLSVQPGLPAQGGADEDDDGSGLWPN